MLGVTRDPRLQCYIAVLRLGPECENTHDRDRGHNDGCKVYVGMKRPVDISKGRSINLYTYKMFDASRVGIVFVSTYSSKVANIC